MISLVITFLLTVTKLHLCSAGSAIFYKDDILSAYQTVGFFSKCDQNDIKTNKNRFNIIAAGFENEIRKVLEFQKNFNFISYDVCYNTELLVKFITDLCLDRRYYLSLSTTDPEPLNQSKPLSSSDQNIIIIIAYVTEEMSNIIRRVFGDLHPIIARLCIPYKCDKRFPFSEMDEYIGQISDFVTRFRMMDMTFINFEYKTEEQT